MNTEKIAILGTGNIGSYIAEGLLRSGAFKPENITLTRRRLDLLENFRKKGFNITSDNMQAVNDASMIILAVRPQQADKMLEEISTALKPGVHTLVSIVTDFTLEKLYSRVSPDVAIVRVMPNTAIAIQQSMTCLCADESHKNDLEEVRAVFDYLGSTIRIEEELMEAATVLAACGVAFFLRAIRAASQGGIQIGFHADEALKIAAQTARGASELLLKKENHPESEIDNVTTPKGITIAGLNEMEHQGFSSSIIKGIIASFEKASRMHD